jgi:hypothetical protein
MNYLSQRAVNYTTVLDENYEWRNLNVQTRQYRHPLIIILSSICFPSLQPASTGSITLYSKLFLVVQMGVFQKVSHQLHYKKIVLSHLHKHPSYIISIPSTYTVALRVVGGDVEGTLCLGV